MISTEQIERMVIERVRPMLQKLIDEALGARLTEIKELLAEEKQVEDAR